MYKQGKTTKKRLQTAHPDWPIIIDFALQYTIVDFGVARAFEEALKQFELFKKGRAWTDVTKTKLVIIHQEQVVTYCDGYEKLSEHQTFPSMAVDFYAYINGKGCWEAESLTSIASILIMSAKILFEQGKITHLVKWGGNWDGDGEIITDQNFNDRPHCVLYKPNFTEL